jgi:hypothetical protein
MKNRISSDDIVETDIEDDMTFDRAVRKRKRGFEGGFESSEDVFDADDDEDENGVSRGRKTKRIRSDDLDGYTLEPLL